MCIDIKFIYKYINRGFTFVLFIYRHGLFFGKIWLGLLYVYYIIWGGRISVFIDFTGHLNRPRVETTSIKEKNRLIIK